MTIIQGKKFMQPFYWWLQRTAYSGLNIGKGGEVLTSGETVVMKHIAQQLVKQNDKAEDWIIFDVGANEGQFVIESIKAFPNSKIHCFEPGKKTFGFLRANVARECANYKNVQFYNFGFSDQRCAQSLYYDAEGSGLASVYKRRIGYGEQEDPILMEEQVELITIDEFCNNEKIDRIHFLKIDVEGHELKVLLGALTSIKMDRIDFIQFEFGETNIDSRTYFRDFWFLLKDRYDFFRVLQDGLYPIEQYNSRHEVFRTTNFLLQRKNN